MSKKIYPQAVLKNLPVKRQEAIVEFLELASIEELVKRANKMGETTEFTRLRPPSLLEAVEWLAKDGIVVSAGVLSEFRSWFLLQRQMRINAATSANMAREEREAGRITTDEEEQATGQRFFNRMALEQQDPKQWYLAQKVALQAQELEFKKKELALKRDKFEFDAAKACLKELPSLKQIAGDSKLDQNAKINAVRAKLFGQLPA